MILRRGFGIAIFSLAHRYPPGSTFNNSQLLRVYSERLAMAPTMRAAVVHEAGGPEALELQDVPIPQPQEHEVLIHIRAFGLNRSEMCKYDPSHFGTTC